MILKVGEYCVETGEGKIDLLMCSLKKELFNQGKRKERHHLGKLFSSLDTPHDPFTFSEHWTAGTTWFFNRNIVETQI